jgi:hypothetical protein
MMQAKLLIWSFFSMISILANTLMAMDMDPVMGTAMDTGMDTGMDTMTKTAKAANGGKEYYLFNGNIKPYKKAPMQGYYFPPPWCFFKLL